MKTLKAVRKELIARLADIFGYTVFSHEYDAMHYCFTRKEALTWMRCYKDACMITGFQIVAASRVL